MRDHHETRPGSRDARLLLWAERLLVLAGAAALIWCAVLVSDAVIAQRIARRSLEELAVVERPVLPLVTAPTTGGPVRDPVVSRGSALGALSIPRVHLSAVVLHGSDAQTLRRGPGHLENTALPGEAGNAVIAGHRDSFFWPLRNIARGDDIFVDTPKGRFRYRVTSLRVVKPDDLSVLDPTDDATLTLITCYPFWVLGNAPDRFVVRAARVVDSISTAFEPATPSPPERSRAAVEAHTANESAPLVTSTLYDDETRVRQAIERFRLIYNARLVSHHDARPDGLLAFQRCDIAVAGDQATATCTAASQSSADREPRVWIVTLQRADGEWAINSIQS
jgi:sortase A